MEGNTFAGKVWGNSWIEDRVPSKPAQTYLRHTFEQISTEGTNASETGREAELLLY